MSLNLDPRAGKSWRVIMNGPTLSLVPSVWKETGCESHFVLWRNSAFFVHYSEELTDDSEDQAFLEWAELLSRSKAPIAPMGRLK